MAEHRRARAFFTPEIEDEILNRIADGESLLRICGRERREGMPNRVAVHTRLRDNDEFRRDYLVARDAQAANLAEEIVEIADGKLPEADRPPSVHRDKLRMTARQWLVSVMAPRTYRDGRDELKEHDKRVRREHW